jgi:NitT/TauT family transport system substrate-binding protein
MRQALNNRPEHTTGAAGAAAGRALSEAIVTASASRRRTDLRTAFGRLAATAGAVMLAAVTMAPPAGAAVAVRLLLDRPVDAVAAPLAVARRGAFAAEELNVTIVPGNSAANGNRNVFTRLAAGEADLALADITALIRYRDRPDAAALKAVYVMTNSAGYAIVARRSRGIRSLSDLAGKTLGYVENESAIAFWPALAKRGGLATDGDDAVQLQRIGAAVREPMLSAGQLDAVTGLTWLAPVNLKDHGIPAGDLTVLRYADYGIAAYGLAIVVSPQFAAARPDALRGFLRAFNVALRMTLKDPAAGVADVLTRMNGGNADLELTRLKTIIRDDILTDEVRRDGLGGIDPERFARALDQLAEGLKLRARPALADIFDASFLPPAASRRLD